MERILRLKDVMIYTGLKKSTIYQRVQEGSFPKQYKLGPRAVGWKYSDIENWISSQIDKA